jgi:hypothetical protein
MKAYRPSYKGPLTSRLESLVDLMMFLSLEIANQWPPPHPPLYNIGFPMLSKYIPSSESLFNPF